METGLILNKSLSCKDTSSFVNSQNTTRPVSFLTESEIYKLADVARDMRDGKRNELLVLLLFQTALRISEALALRLRDKQQIDGKYLLMVERGKGGKPRLLAIPEKLYFRLGNYASENNLTDPGDKFFDISRVRAWQIIKQCAAKSGLDYKRIYPHLFRHSGAVSRLMKTGNLQSLKMYLGHSDNKMTQRYLTTMQVIQSVEVESKVTFER